MSDMLEQAIIDAEALKKAAAKNAETLVLERYSSQIKEAVESLLEQDEAMDPLAAAPPMDPAASPAGDPAAVDPTMGADPAAATLEPGMPAEKSSVLEHIPLAATSKDDEEIEIPLDKLTEELAAFNESFKFGGDSHNISELFEHNLAEFNEEELEEALDEELDEDLDEELDEDLDEELDEELNIESTEELEEAIVEALTVDLPGSNKGGWPATPESLMELAEEEILAIEQDSRVREEKQLIRKALNKLENVNESLNTKNKKLSKTLNEAKKQLLKLKKVSLTLYQKLEESNLTNAKLLYQNKAMTSDSLNERQKVKLVEAVSNAESIEEARVIFETLQSTVGSTSRKTRPKSLSEAIEKPSSMVLSARKQKSRSQKPNPTLDRWKFLAGIDKK